MSNVLNYSVLSEVDKILRDTAVALFSVSSVDDEMSIRPVDPILD